MGKPIKSAVLGIAIMAGLLLSGCMNEKNDQDKKEEPSVMFRGNAAHTGTSAAKGPESFKGVKWTFKAKDMIRSSPVILEGVVYVGSHDHNLYAIDANTGAKKWAFVTKGPILSTPAVTAQSVYIFSGDGSLYAVNTADGSLQWSFLTEGEDPPRDQVDYWQSSPTLSEGILYFGAGNSMFYAVDAATGKLVWKKKMPFNEYECENCAPILHSTAAVSDGVVYIGVAGYDTVKYFEPGNVFALDAKTGEDVWASKLITAVDSAIVADEELLYFGMRNYGLAALDKKTGEKRWQSNDIHYLLATPVLHEGILYSGSSDDHILVSLDPATGEKIWKFDTIGPIHSSPVTDGITVYAATGNHYTEDNLGMIYAVDAKTGEEKWKFQPGGNVYSSPTLDNGVLFIGSDDGNLYAIQ